MVQKSERVFIDTNILVYSTFDDFDAEKHAQSLKSLDKLLQNENQFFVSPQILREFFATSTNGNIFKKPLTHKQAVGKMKEFLKHFTFIQEKESTIFILMGLIEKYAVSRQKIHDMNIVATMIDNGIANLLTYNKQDFKQVKEITLL